MEKYNLCATWYDHAASLAACSMNYTSFNLDSLPLVQDFYRILVNGYCVKRAYAGGV